MEILDKVLEWINFAMTWQGLLAVAIVVETIFRFFKTEKPLSIAWLIRNIFMQLAKIFEAVAILLDKILPQKTK